ncbi:MAG TPA: beta-ketoacyl synthase N-terminal-like domain-containing protein [Nitrospirota bacterium]
MNAVVVASDMITPYGRGTHACWEGLNAGRTAVSRVDRFSTKAFQSDYAGIVSNLQYRGGTSLVMQMLRLLFDGATFPADAKLLLATTKGEIDLLEQSMLANGEPGEESLPSRLMARVAAMTGLDPGGMVISAACTSSAAAMAQAAALIRNGRTDCVLVAACDGVSEFIFSGFSSLMAMDRLPARPFDRDRAGLNVGEAAAYALLMSGERAGRENRPVLGSILGWGLSDDANHMTGPSRESEGLILAVTKAISAAGIAPEDIGCIAAHGTGTVFNDAMEMRAFRAVFKDSARPLYSIKGGIGHTMGAAGLVETIIAMKALKEGTIPPTVNLKQPDADAAGWVSDQSRPIRAQARALVTNAGFSGVNTALVLG